VINAEIASVNDAVLRTVQSGFGASRIRNPSVRRAAGVVLDVSLSTKTGVAPFLTRCFARSLAEGTIRMTSFSFRL